MVKIKSSRLFLKQKNLAEIHDQDNKNACQESDIPANNKNACQESDMPAKLIKDRYFF